MSTLRCVTSFLEVPRTTCRTISPSSHHLPFTWAPGAEVATAGSEAIGGLQPRLFSSCVEGTQAGWPEVARQ